MARESDGYRKIRASTLTQIQQDSLRSALQHDLVEELIRAVRENPPEIDLSKVEVVLAGQSVPFGSESGNCGTCGTCVTCVTCVTS